jgi:hypothetical protein
MDVTNFCTRSSDKLMEHGGKVALGVPLPQLNLPKLTFAEQRFDIIALQIELAFEIDGDG